MPIIPITMTDANGIHPDGSRDGRCLAVMYHYVHHAPPPTGPDVPSDQCGVRGLTTDQFRDQVAHLCRTMEPIDWPTLFAARRGGPSLPNRCFLLTFDDGLACNRRYALPVLEEFGLRGVFFVPTLVLTRHRMLAAHAMHLLFGAVGDERLAQLVSEKCEEFGETLADWSPHETFAGDPAERHYAYENGRRAELKEAVNFRIPLPQRDDIVDSLFAAHVGSTARWAKDWYLSWDDLYELQRRGHTVGGHGHTHEPLTRFTPAQQQADIAQCASVLTDGLGIDIRPFSYPFGRVCETAAGAVRMAGFAHAFTTEEAIIARDHDDLRLPRIDTIHVPTEPQETAACRSV